MKLSPRFLKLGLALVMASYAAASLVSASPATAPANDRPFKGQASGTILTYPDTMGTPGVVEYTGRATHLGRFTRTEYFFLGEGGRVYGFMIYTAANGDQLTLDFDGFFISGTTAVGFYNFTGGTGRFRDAAGMAAFEAVVDDQGQVEATFDGSIQY